MLDKGFSFVFTFPSPPKAKRLLAGGCAAGGLLKGPGQMEKAELHLLLLLQSASLISEQNTPFTQTSKTFSQVYQALQMPFFWHWLARAQFKVSTQCLKQAVLPTAGT